MFLKIEPFGCQEKKTTDAGGQGRGGQEAKKFSHPNSKTDTRMIFRVEFHA